MECPDCGFVCLPDDVECLACGTNISGAIKNKKLEAKRSIEAANRQAEYEHKFRKELFKKMKQRIIDVLPQATKMNLEQT